MRLIDLPLEKLWISAKEEGPVICTKAMNISLQSPTFYLGKQTFSYLIIRRARVEFI